MEGPSGALGLWFRGVVELGEVGQWGWGATGWQRAEGRRTCPLTPAAGHRGVGCSTASLLSPRRSHSHHNPSSSRCFLSKREIKWGEALLPPQRGRHFGSRKRELAGCSEKQLPSAQMFRTSVVLGQRGREPTLPTCPLKTTRSAGCPSLGQSPARARTGGSGHEVEVTTEPLALLRAWGRASHYPSLEQERIPDGV